ncbi:unnamed protein product [Wuchereria bancrofti]|uniref:Uncharacterized protein n=1 Tax=Wuchereria bancrofti TaxID=6293 RepID=A0A3P7F4U9_WUCBA|nr:unnamed protein product [Wuchereria bancrofti]
MWKLLRIKDIKIDKDREVRNVQVETLTGKFLGRPINILYPLVNDEENHLELNNKESTKVLETEQNIGKLQEPIAMRTRSNTKRQSRSKEVSKSNLIVSLLSVSMLYTLMITVKAKKECQWETGIPFNIPEKWNCEEITAQNSSLLQVNVYTRSPITVPAIKCNNITRTVCTKAFLIVLWDIQQITKKCRYRKVGKKTQLYKNHVIIDELQTSFVFSKDNKTFRSENCNFSNPNLMDGDTVIDIVTRIANNRNRRNTNLALASPRGKLMMMETQRGDDSDPENTKFQYLFDSLQQEFQQQLKLVEQRTCENRNNLLLLIEWLSLDNPTLAANLLLLEILAQNQQTIDPILKPQETSDSLNLKTIEFRDGLISKFEIDKINVALEILAQNQQTINPILKPREISKIWDELKQLEGEFEKTTAYLQAKLNPNHQRVEIIPMETLRTPPKSLEKEITKQANSNLL